MLSLLLVVGGVLCAVQALRAERLLVAAMWLGGLSALVAVTLYTMGAAEVAVVELSVGAGLVTVLFVFAINLAGEDTIIGPAIVPRPLAWALLVATLLLLGWLALPLAGLRPTAVEPPLAGVLWQQRSLDVLLQIALIFAGVLGVLGLLADARRAVEAAALVDVQAVPLAGAGPDGRRARPESVPESEEVPL